MRARKTFSRWDATARAGLTVLECDTSKQLYIGAALFGGQEMVKMVKMVKMVL